jgi:hypothetical protein
VMQIAIRPQICALVTLQGYNNVITLLSTHHHQATKDHHRQVASQLCCHAASYTATTGRSIRALISRIMQHLLPCRAAAISLAVKHGLQLAKLLCRAHLAQAVASEQLALLAKDARGHIGVYELPVLLPRLFAPCLPEICLSLPLPFASLSSYTPLGLRLLSLFRP